MRTALSAESSADAVYYLVCAGPRDFETNGAATINLFRTLPKVGKIWYLTSGLSTMLWKMLSSYSTIANGNLVVPEHTNSAKATEKGRLQGSWNFALGVVSSLWEKWN